MCGLLGLLLDEMQDSVPGVFDLVGLEHPGNEDEPRVTKRHLLDDGADVQVGRRQEVVKVDVHEFPAGEENQTLSGFCGDHWQLLSLLVSLLDGIFILAFIAVADTL